MTGMQLHVEPHLLRRLGGVDSLRLPSLDLLGLTDLDIDLQLCLCE